MVPAISSLPCLWRCSTSCARIMSAMATERFAYPFSPAISSNCSNNFGCRETLKRVASSLFIDQNSMGVEMPQDMGPLQPMREHQGFVVEQLPQRTICNQLSTIQNNGPRAHLHCKFQVVR